MPASSARTLFQLDFSMDPMVGSSAIIMPGGPPRAAAGQGQKQGESLLPFGAAAPGTRAPGTDRASQAAVAAWERAHGIGGGGAAQPGAGATPGSDLGGAVMLVPYPVAGGGGVAAPAARSPGAPALSHKTSPTLIALAASALGLVLVMGLIVAGVVARNIARRRQEEGVGVVVGAATAGAATASASTAAGGGGNPPGPSSPWWRWPASAVRVPAAPFSGDSALGTPAAAHAAPPAGGAPNLSPGIGRRLVSVDDSAYGEDGPGSAPGSRGGGGGGGHGDGPSRFASFFDRPGRRVEDSADPEA